MSTKWGHLLSPPAAESCHSLLSCSSSGVFFSSRSPHRKHFAFLVSLRLMDNFSSSHCLSTSIFPTLESPQCSSKPEIRASAWLLCSVGSSLQGNLTLRYELPFYTLHNLDVYIAIKKLPPCSEFTIFERARKKNPPLYVFLFLTFLLSFVHKKNRDFFASHHGRLCSKTALRIVGCDHFSQL